MKKLHIIFILLLSVSLELFAQQVIQVRGRIVDSEGEPVTGASVLVKNTQTGTISDLDGKYTIKCQKDAVLRFSYIGMVTQSVDVKGKTIINVEMKSDVNLLNEVVSIGYATMVKKDLTGTVSSVSGKQLSEIPITDVAQALTGKISGVQITQNTGEIDGTVSIKVRGGTSITQANDPLIIIDGVPSDLGFVGVSANDIESIDVLKDASACAIYGARGANGVILVSTKGAKAKKPTVNYEMYYGQSQPTKEIEVLDVADFVKLEFERTLRTNTFKDPGAIQSVIGRYGNWSEIEANYPSSSNINWQKKIYGQTAVKQMHRFNVSGGDKVTSYSFSYTRSGETGILQNSFMTRDIVRATVNTKVTNKLTVRLNGNYTNQVANGMSTTNYSSLMVAMMQYRPTGGITMTQDEFLQMSTDSIDASNPVINPLVNANTETNNRQKTILTGSANVEYSFLKNLVYKGNVAYTSNNTTNKVFYDEANARARTNGGANGSIYHNFSDKLMFNNTLNYSLAFDSDNDLKVLLGQEAIFNNITFENLTAMGFPDDNFGLNDMAMGTTANVSTGFSDNKSYSFFTNVNYKYTDKYLLTITLRADGSSKFGNDHKWGFFPSSAFAWRAGEEKFIKNLNVFSNLKFRTSYGMTGNSNIPDFASLNLYDRSIVSVNNALYSAYGVAHLANPELVWEKNITSNIGVDFGFFKNRLSGMIDFYQTNTKDLLLAAKLPYTTGFSTVMKNIGATQNKGIEIELNSTNISNENFTWQTGLNIAFNKNKVVALADGADSFIQTASSATVEYLVKVGEPLGLMYGYVYDGIYTADDFNYNTSTKTYTLKDGVTSRQGYTVQPGSAKFKNVDGSTDNAVTTSDKTIIGNGQPLFFGGLSNTFKYKDFDLSVFANFNYGNDVFNGVNRTLMCLSYTNRNVKKSAFDSRYKLHSSYGEYLFYDPARLTEINDNAKYPSIEGWRQTVNVNHTLFVEDGSFLRINNITLGYSLPQRILSKAKIKNLRVYATINNLYTFTNYSGLDPEVSVNDNALTPGLDWGSQARSRSGVVGLSLTF